MKHLFHMSTCMKAYLGNTQKWIGKGGWRVGKGNFGPFPIPRLRFFFPNIQTFYSCSLLEDFIHADPEYPSYLT